MESILPALLPSVSLASTTDSCVASFRAVYWCVIWRSYWWAHWIPWKLGICVSETFIRYLVILTRHSTGIYSKESTDPWQQGSFVVMNEYLEEKKTQQYQLSSKLLMERGKDPKKEKEMVKWEEGSCCAYRLRRSARKRAAMETERYFNFYYHELLSVIVRDRRRLLRLWVVLL